MAICEDAPCCGCCGRDLYGNDAWAPEEPADPEDLDFWYDPGPTDEDMCEFCGEPEGEAGLVPMLVDPPTAAYDVRPHLVHEACGHEWARRIVV